MEQENQVPGHLTEDEHARGTHRSRRASATAVAAVWARASAAILMLVSVPLTSKYLGEERYGVWLTISSFIALLSFADLGIGVGLLNSIAYANGKDDVDDARRHISTACLILGGICIAICLGLAIAFPLVAWHRIFNVAGALAKAETGPAVLVCLVSIALNLPLGIVQRVQTGFQLGAQTYLWNSLGSWLGLGCLLVAVRNELGLPWLAGCYVLVPTIATLLNAIAFFGWQRPDLRPARRYVSREAARGLVRLGMAFVVLQTLVALANNLDPFIIAHALTQADVAKFALTVRLFSLVAMLIGFVTNALWPAFAEASSRGDDRWLRRSFMRAARGSIGLTFVGAILIVGFGTVLVKAWSQSVVTVGLSLLVPRALFALSDSLVGISGTLLSALSKVWIQAVAMGTYVLASIVAKPLLAARFGLEGVAWAGFWTNFLLVCLPLSIAVRHVLWRSGPGGT